MRIKIADKLPDVPEPESTTHYFGTSCYNWAKGKSVEDVLVKLGSMIGPGIMRTLKQAKSEGFYVWVCKVNAPQSTQYPLNFFQPQDVELLESWEFNMMNAKGHVLPITREKDDAKA